MPVDRRRALGAAGEAAVEQWYVEAGYQLLDRNWRCREGELDLIVGRRHEVVFCEVKTRSSSAFGSPMEAVTLIKQRRLRVLASRWLADHPDVRAGALRFDVASVMAKRDAPLQIDVLEGAF